MRSLSAAQMGILKLFKPFLCHGWEALRASGALLQV